MLIKAYESKKWFLKAEIHETGNKNFRVDYFDISAEIPRKLNITSLCTTIKEASEYALKFTGKDVL